MSLREPLSDIAPQIGAKMPEIRKLTAKMMLLHQLTSSVPTPSSSMRYIGRNGMSMV